MVFVVLYHAVTGDCLSPWGNVLLPCNNKVSFNINIIIVHARQPSFLIRILLIKHNSFSMKPHYHMEVSNDSITPSWYMRNKGILSDH